MKEQYGQCKKIKEHERQGKNIEVHWRKRKKTKKTNKTKMKQNKRKWKKQKKHENKMTLKKMK